MRKDQGHPREVWKSKGHLLILKSNGAASTTECTQRQDVWSPSPWTTSQWGRGHRAEGTKISQSSAVMPVFYQWFLHFLENSTAKPKRKCMVFLWFPPPPPKTVEAVVWKMTTVCPTPSPPHLHSDVTWSGKARCSRDRHWGLVQLRSCGCDNLPHSLCTHASVAPYLAAQTDRGLAGEPAPPHRSHPPAVCVRLSPRAWGSETLGCCMGESTRGKTSAACPVKKMHSLWTQTNVDWCNTPYCWYYRYVSHNNLFH